ncbi:MAG: ABC transporter permease [Betaproteobacteria bacterium]|nr:MAG: ABC transporter permease [Betaproteobacteria bacterium]
MRLEVRANPSAMATLLAGVGAVVFTLLVCALLILWANANVFAAYGAIFQGALGSQFAITETLTRATPLMLTGLAAAVAFRARLYNIGAEGQLYFGAMAAVAASVAMSNEAGELALPTFIAMPLMIAAGAVAGAALLLIPTLLKTRFKVDEVVTTLLLNFIALLFVSMLLDGPMKDPTAMGWPQSRALLPELEFAKLVERGRVHIGLLIAIALAIVLWIVMGFTRFGLSIRAVGANAKAAEFAGISVNATLIKVALLSGALAGLAGVGEVAGRTSYVTLDMSPGYGFSGIVIAMLAALNPLGVVFASVFVGGAIVGADAMSRAVNVPTYIADVIVATALIAVLVASLLTKYRVRWK